MKILVTGDLVVCQEYETSNIDNSIVSLFNQSDLNIINLEAPVTESLSKILKTGPNLKANRERTLDVLNKLNIRTVTLANNHVLDYGEKGVQDTLNFCLGNNIKTVGAGMDLSEANETLFIDSSEGNIAIVNFAENEWTSATDSAAGFNPMNIIDNVAQIKKAKQKADYILVIIHGGHEYYNLPSPRMQKQYRFYAEQGADIIIGHHTHCISGNEIWKGVPIYYSLGNFLFTKDSVYKDWYNGLVLEIEIKNGNFTCLLHPVKQEKESFKLSIVEREEKKMTFDRIQYFNKVIQDPLKLKNEWDKYVAEMYKTYLGYCSPLIFIKNRYINAILNRLGVSFINKKGIALKLNIMRCEAHVDLSKEVKKKYLEQ